MRAWPWILPAGMLLAACSFSPPSEAPGGDAPRGDGGGDPMADAPPTCVDGDADGDGVCNAADRCADADDRLDADSDAVPDGCDDWPCGLKPADPGGLMSDEAPGRSWGASLIDIGEMRRVVADPGEEIDARFGWGITIDCPPGYNTCRAQLEIGYGPTRIGCVYDNNVADNQLRGGYDDLEIDAPMTPGVYEIRLNAGRREECGTGADWYMAAPGSESTIAILCVRP